MSRISSDFSLRWPTRGRALIGSICLVAPLLAALAGGGEIEPIGDAEALWRGIDPQALPLDRELLDGWREPAGSFQKLRFTSEVCDGVPARVFAIYGAPPISAQDPAERVPGILHIHGGGQTASLEWVRFWVQRGYTCLTFDFCGPWADRQEVTNWGPIQHANMAQASGGLQVRPTPRESSWFHWGLAARRALTVLAQHPQTDPDRLGIFGISMGGTLCWLVAASDERVQTAVPIYGCGYNHDDRRQRFGFAKLSDDLQLYKRTVAPEAHAPLIHVPVLFLNATNDFHGPLDFAFDTLGVVRGPVRWAFTPRFNHHIAPREAKDLPLWMDWQLRGGPAWPETPQVRIDLSADGIPRVHVQPDRADEVASVEVLYSLDDRLPAARYWRAADVKRAGAGWQAATPVMSVDQPLLALASVTYRSGVTLSSNLPTVLPRAIQSDAPARATLEWTPHLSDGPSGFANWYYTASATDPSRETTYLATAVDGDEAYLTHDPQHFPRGGPVQFSTHLVGDPQHIGRPGDVLTFEYRGDFGEPGFSVRAFEHDWSPRSKTFAASVLPRPAGEGRGEGAPPDDTKSTEWRTVSLTPNQLQSPDGQALAGWRDVQRLELTGQSTSAVGFRRFRWLPGE